MTYVTTAASSLAKGFAHGPLSLHPSQIELEFVIPADRHLAVFTSLPYNDDITFDQWALLTVSRLGRCKMAAPSVFSNSCEIFQIESLSDNQKTSISPVIDGNDIALKRGVVNH